jgi:hypothetical protein
MKKEVTKEIRICDVCERENTYLQKCIVCGKEYCLICQSIIPGCMISVGCCKVCADRDDVNEIVRKYAKPLSETKQQRDKELQALLSN